MLFPFQPEIPLVERLDFLSDVSVAKDGTEQRINLRLAPRQSFEVTLLVENAERARIENLLFGRQTDPWDLPLWAEPMFVTTAIAPGATSFDVQLHEYTDFRAGNSVVIWNNESDCEVLEDCTLASDTLTTITEVVGTYPVGTQVFVLRPCLIVGQITPRRYAVNLTSYNMVFSVTDNITDLEDVSAYPEFEGKPMLSNPNAITSDTLSESWDRATFTNDGNTGTFEQVSYWDRSRRGSAKTFVTTNRADLWKVKQFLYWSRGRVKSFYLPTFGADLLPAAAIASGTTTLDVVTSGYTDWSQNKEPRNRIRVVLRDGTVYTNVITDSNVLSPAAERLDVSDAWPANVTQANIARIEIIEKVRSDTDSMAITYENSNGQATIGFPVKTVFE